MKVLSSPIEREVSQGKHQYKPPYQSGKFRLTMDLYQFSVKNGIDSELCLSDYAFVGYFGIQLWM